MGEGRDHASDLGLGNANLLREVFDLCGMGLVLVVRPLTAKLCLTSNIKACVQQFSSPGMAPIIDDRGAHRKAHRLVDHSSPGLRVIKGKKVGQSVSVTLGRRLVLMVRPLTLQQLSHTGVMYCDGTPTWFRV